jgi:hypothetical protein
MKTILAGPKQETLIHPGLIYPLHHYKVGEELSILDTISSAAQEAAR